MWKANKFRLGFTFAFPSESRPHVPPLSVGSLARPRVQTPPLHWRACPLTLRLLLLPLLLACSGRRNQSPRFTQRLHPPTSTFAFASSHRVPCRLCRDLCTSHRPASCLIAALATPSRLPVVRHAPSDPGVLRLSILPILSIHARLGCLWQQLDCDLWGFARSWRRPLPWSVAAWHIEHEPFFDSDPPRHVARPPRTLRAVPTTLSYCPGLGR